MQSTSAEPAGSGGESPRHQLQEEDPGGEQPRSAAEEHRVSPPATSLSSVAPVSYSTIIIYAILYVYTHFKYHVLLNIGVGRYSFICRPSIHRSTFHLHLHLSISLPFSLSLSLSAPSRQQS